MSQPPPQREWSYAAGKIVLTDRALKVDRPGQHAAIALTEIVGVERAGAWGATTLTIAHRGGKLKLDYVKAKVAKEIAEALGF
jgi:hypothetical protein